MAVFTPWSALLGGALIGASASLLLMFNGRVAGISGIVAGLIERSQAAPRAESERWRAWFLGGLGAGGVLLLLLQPSAFGSSPRSLPVLVGAGLLVGIGTRISGGCTSGHAVCGIARGSLRSIVATLMFMATGMSSAFVLRGLLGATP